MLADSWCKPLDEDDSQLSEQPSVGGIEEENREQYTESSDREEDAQRDTPLSESVTSSPEIKPEILNITEDSESSSSYNSLVMLVTVKDIQYSGDIIG